MATFSPKPLTEVTAPPVGAATGGSAPPPATTNTAANINALTGLATIGFQSIGVFTDIAKKRNVKDFTKGLAAIEAKSAAGSITQSQETTLIRNLHLDALTNNPEQAADFSNAMVAVGIVSPIKTENVAAENARAKILEAGHLLLGQGATTEQALEAGQEQINNQQRVATAKAVADAATRKAVVDVNEQRQAGFVLSHELFNAAKFGVISTLSRNLANTADTSDEAQRVLDIRGGITSITGTMRQTLDEATRLFDPSSRDDVMKRFDQTTDMLLGDGGIFDPETGPLDFKVFTDMVGMLDKRTELDSLQSMGFINTLRKAVGSDVLGVLMKDALLTLKGGAGMNQLITALGQELSNSIGVTDATKLDLRQTLSLIQSPEAAEKLADDPDFRRGEAVKYLDAITNAMNRTEQGAAVLDTGYAAATSNLVVLADKFISRASNLSHVMDGFNRQGHVTNLNALNKVNPEQAGLIGDRINTIAFKSVSRAMEDMGNSFNFVTYKDGKFTVRNVMQDQTGKTVMQTPTHITTAVKLANLALDVAVKHREYNPAIMGTNATDAQVRDFMVNAGQFMTSTDYTKGVPLDLGFKPNNGTVGDATKELTQRLPPADAAFDQSATQLENLVRERNRAQLTARLPNTPPAPRTVIWTEE